MKLFKKIPSVMFFYRLIVLLIYAISHAIALKCYSCGDENLYIDAKYPDSPPCEEMDRSMDLKKFEIECPAEYLGCITQKKGKEIMRTCDIFAIDDCKTANGITYCYCSKDLCNYQSPELPQIMGHTDARKASRDINYPSDDEDYNDDLDDQMHDIDKDAGGGGGVGGGSKINKNGVGSNTAGIRSGTNIGGVGNSNHNNRKHRKHRNNMNNINDDDDDEDDEDDDDDDDDDDEDDNDDDIKDGSGMHNLGNQFDKGKLNREVEVIFNSGNRIFNLINLNNNNYYSSPIKSNIKLLIQISLIFILLKTTTNLILE